MNGHRSETWWWLVCGSCHNEKHRDGQKEIRGRTGEEREGG